MKFLSLTLLTLFCCFCLGCGECQGAKSFATPPTPPSIPSEPTDDEKTEEPPMPEPNEEPTDGEPEQPPIPEETPNQSEQDQTNEEAQTPPKETPETEQPETEKPEQTILTANEDTIEIPANTTLIYRFQANRAGILSIASDSPDCVLSVKKLLENGEETSVDTLEEYAVQAGDEFLITVSNSSKKSLEWCIFLNP